MKPNVLVTGGAGYLGSVLCERLLERGFNVTVVDNLMFGQCSLLHLACHEGFAFVRGDARDESLIKRLLADADVVIPLACLVGAPLCDRDPQTAQSVNLGAVETLLRLRSPSQSIVFPTTNSGYGTQSGEVYCTEDTPLSPISLYGRTKVEAERRLLDADNTVTLRLATVFGVSSRMRLDLLVNHFTWAAATDGYLVIFEKDFKRNYIHIRDVADCFVHCVDNMDSMRGRPYNAGLDDANLSKEELALQIKQHVDPFYIHFAEIGADPDRRNYIVSNERLRKSGFEAKRSLDHGIRELLKAFAMMGRSQFANV